MAKTRAAAWATRHQCREPGEVKNENTGKTFNWNTSLLERPQFHEGLGVSLQCSSTGLGGNVKLLEDNYDLHQRSLLEISSSRAQLQWWYDHDWFKVMHGTQTCINYLMIQMILMQDSENMIRHHQNGHGVSHTAQGGSPTRRGGPPPPIGGRHSPIFHETSQELRNCPI